MLFHRINIASKQVNCGTMRKEAKYCTGKRKMTVKILLLEHHRIAGGGTIISLETKK
jgi:hypothetical protein